MRVVIKVSEVFLLVFLLSSCRTSYYAQHWFAEREYQPVKKGKLEMIIRKKAFPVSSSKAVSWKQAYDSGMKEVNQSIKQFCDGKYSLQKISEEKDRIGTLYDTSIVHSSSVANSFSGNVYSSTVTGASPVYNHYTGIVFQCQ